MSTKLESTKVWNNIDYTNTEAYKSIQAWKEGATEAGLNLEFPKDSHSHSYQNQNK
jgi:hypothetical protein